MRRGLGPVGACHGLSVIQIVLPHKDPCFVGIYIYWSIWGKDIAMDHQTRGQWLPR